MDTVYIAFQATEAQDAQIIKICTTATGAHTAAYEVAVAFDRHDAPDLFSELVGPVDEADHPPQGAVYSQRLADPATGVRPWVTWVEAWPVHPE